MRNTSAALTARLRLRRRAGFTLLEVAMVLAIAALIVAGVMLFYNNASTGQKTEDAMSEVGNIQQTVRSLYAGQPDYTALQVSDLINSGQMPHKWVSGTGLTNAFGGAVLLTVAAATPGQYSVELDGLPQQACARLATMDLGTGMSSVSIDTVPATTAGAPFTPASAGTACAVTGTHKVAWTFS